LTNSIESMNEYELLIELINSTYAMTSDYNKMYVRKLYRRK
jgi:hypothetical protein